MYSVPSMYVLNFRLISFQERGTIRLQYPLKCHCSLNLLYLLCPNTHFWSTKTIHILKWWDAGGGVEVFGSVVDVGSIGQQKIVSLPILGIKTHPNHATVISPTFIHIIRTLSKIRLHTSHGNREHSDQLQI